MSDKKKPKIKSFKSIAKVASVEEAEELLEKISKAINQIYNFETSTLRYQEYYSYCYTLTMSKKEKILYNSLKSIIEEKTKIITEQLKGVQRENLLVKFRDLWDTHKTCTGYVKNLMSYLETGYIQQNRLTPIYDLGLITFKELVFKDETLCPKLNNLLMEMINKDRNGEVIEKDVIKSISNMLIEVGLNSRQMYKEILEDSFLMQTDIFYNNEAKLLIDEIQVPEFLKKAEERLEEEKRRVFAYLDISSMEPLLRLVDKNFIEINAKALVNSDSGLAKMINNTSINDICRMYRLYQRTHDLQKEIHACLERYILEKCEEIVKNQESIKNPIKLISDIIELREKIILIHTSAFKRDIMAEVSIRRSFENVFNKYPRIVLALVLYIDYLFQKEIKGISDEEIDLKLNKIIALFKYISDKDVFESYYKNYLAKRLLSDKSLNDEAEKSFVRLMKTECGSQYTSRIEGMINDMGVAKQDSNHFQNTAQFDFEVRVLTQTYWPQDDLQPILLPVQLAQISEKFTNFYMTQHSGRRLNWKHSYGNCILKANIGCEGKQYELLVSTYQACVLLLYNETDNYPLTSIISSLRGFKDELVKHILGLVKAKILTKPARGKDLPDDSVLTLNTKFTNKLKRIQVTIISSKEKEKNSQSQTMVDEERKHVIESAIIRVMKSRRELEHPNLIVEVCKLVSHRFTPDIKTVKKRIESLIERDYLERDERNINLYRYKA
ncbi:unnamed protein product [Blepharisma stoltei]|uniref:Cullin family profile domain-containing protein n=1 Tax=Blepharisma stoltei TaxID=1481888 RepID=A0AAU9J9J3_9CILI|nr:unnamed protein product [Blepharisma stoltei]